MKIFKRIIIPLLSLVILGGGSVLAIKPDWSLWLDTATSDTTGLLSDFPKPTSDGVADNTIPDDGYDLNNLPSSIDLPKFTGEPFVEIDGNIPNFGDYSPTQAHESYTMDELGRPTTAIAAIDQSIMPTEKRGAIGSVKPPGWHTIKYDIVDGKYLYNRCHLIGFQLTGENANEENLITGTRYLNIQGMLDFENDIAEYVKRTDDLVLYEVAPVYIDNEPVARGLIMQAKSLGSDEISFRVYAFNVQPGIEIDYSTGNSELITQ